MLSTSGASGGSGDAGGAGSGGAGSGGAASAGPSFASIPDDSDCDSCGGCGLSNGVEVVVGLGVRLLGLGDSSGDAGSPPQPVSAADKTATPAARLSRSFFTFLPAI